MKKLALFSGLAIMAFSTSAIADYGINIGGAVGYSASHFQGYNNRGLFAARIKAGYNFTQNVGAELGYTSYRDSTVNGGPRITQHSYDVLAVISYPILDQFAIYTKLGMARMVGTMHQTPTGDVDGRTWRFAHALGLTYNLTAHLTTNGEWYHVQGKAGAFSNGANMPASDLYSLGLAYHF